MSLLFKNYSLLKFIYLLIRCSKTRFFLWNTNITDSNGVNKQNAHTHTHQTLKWKGFVIMKISDTPLFWNNPTCFTHPFIFMRKIWTPFFENFKNSTPSPSIKGGGEGFATMLSFFKLRKWHSLTKK